MFANFPWDLLFIKNIKNINFRLGFPLREA